MVKEKSIATAAPRQGQSRDAIKIVVVKSVKYRFITVKIRYVLLHAGGPEAIH